MSFEFKFPDVGEGITEGKLLKWKFQEGDSVQQDQALAEVETDKAVVEIPSPKTAKIAKLHAKEGDTIQVGSVIVTFDDGGTPSAPKAAPQASQPAQQPSSQPAPAPQPQKQAQKEESKKPEQPTQQSDAAAAAEKAGATVGFLEEAKDDAPKPSGPEKAAAQRKIAIATLAVKKLARDLKVDITAITGTGPGGRISDDDVKKAAGTAESQPKAEKQTEDQAKPAGPVVSKKYDFYGYIEHLPMSSIRKAVSHKMVESAYTAPQVTHMDEADITELFHIREKEKKAAEEKGIKLTYLPFIVKATVAALQLHPLLNATLDEEKEEIILKKYYNIGIAVDTPEGLIVPVVKRAEGKSILQLADEIAKYAAAAKERKLGLSDMKGGSFTISNIGVIGGIFFTPILNFPESALLGLGRLMDKPVVIDGKVEIRKILPLSVSFDHRIIDGAEAARFTKDLIRHLEDPDLILVEGH